MERIIHKMNMLWGATVTLLSALLGEFWFLFVGFLVLNVIDYITGVIKAKQTHKESSKVGLRGIIKKFGYWVVVVLSFFIALTFGQMGEHIGVNLDFTMFIGWFTLATFIINELRSILENLIAIGVVVPQFLIKGLEVAAEAVEIKAENKNK